MDMEMENTITLTELLAVMIRKWKGICAVLLVFALLLGAYQAYRQIRRARDPENSPEKIEERYQAALTNYETQKENLQENLENQKKSLASKEEYLEKSILLQIDPYNEYVANIVFTFANIDESAQLFRYPNTSADYLPKKIRSQYIGLWNSMDVSKDINIAKYADVEWKYLSEIISVSNLEGEMVSIQAFGATETDAEELADAVYRYFETHRDVIAAGSAQHSFALVNRTTKSMIDENLSTKRESLEAEIEELKETIETSEQSIADLAEPVREEGYSVKVIIKSVVKYAVLGAVAGVFLACLLLCCWWIFAGKAASSFQLERVVRAPFLGSLKIPDSPVERLAIAVMGERSWADQEQAEAYICEQAKAHFPREGTILLLSTVPEKEAGGKVETMEKILKKDGYAVASVLDALHNPQAVEMLQTCAAVAFAEMAGYSSLTAIQNAVMQAQRAEKKILGVVTI